MPVKKRLAKVRQNRITPGAIAAFRAGDRKDLAEALELPPWHVSPLDVERGALLGEGLLEIVERGHHEARGQLFGSEFKEELSHGAPPSSALPSSRS